MSKPFLISALGIVVVRNQKWVLLGVILSYCFPIECEKGYEGIKILNGINEYLFPNM